MRTYDELKDIAYSEMTEDEVQTMVELRVNQAKQEAQTGFIADLNKTYTDNLASMVNVISKRFEEIKDSLPVYKEAIS